ncbi:hypothetical protein Adt_39273 [Abeliophyllum distichum]|uniref:Uncharacterized protein n=1 Tax=Abeliophyllum distichum TaxID=126358 RepID=A0ABD1Q4L4_9LAMI
MPKMIQTKISLIERIVIREPSPNSGRSNVEKVVGKDKEKATKPLSKAKPSLRHPHSFSKTTQPWSSSGKKRPSSDSQATPGKKQKTSSSSRPYWLNCSSTARRVCRLL